MATKKFCDVCGKEISNMMVKDRVIIKNDNDYIYLDYDLCSDCEIEIKSRIKQLRKEKKKAQEEKLKNDK